MKKSLALLLTVVMIAALVPVISVGASAAWDGTSTEKFTGSGTSADPYIIASAENLAYLANQVNVEYEDYEGKYFTQTADIDLGDKEWTPIGSGSTFFSGVYDGLGHKITGLRITNGALGKIGLFGYLMPTYDHECGIMNLDLSGKCEFEEITVDAGMGGLVGWVYKDSTDGFKECKIINIVCTVDFVVKATAKQPRFGAVLGYCFNAYVENVVNYGNITYEGSANSRVGGIVGQTNRTHFVNCVNNGTVNVHMLGTATAHTGGISGMTTYKVADILTHYDHCVNNGTFTVTTDGGKIYLGGIVGAVYSSATDYFILADHCLNTGKLYGENTLAETTNPTYVGGIIAYGNKPNIAAEGCVNTSFDINGKYAGNDIGGGIISAFEVTDDSVYIKDCINITSKSFGVENTCAKNCEDGASDAKLDPAKAAILANIKTADAVIDGFPGSGEPEATTVVITDYTNAPETPPETPAPETEPETAAPETEAPATAAPETEPAKKSGCGSSAMAVTVLVAVMGTALIRRKH